MARGAALAAAFCLCLPLLVAKATADDVVAADVPNQAAAQAAAAATGSRRTTISSYSVMDGNGALAEYTVNKKFVDNVNIAGVYQGDWQKYKYNQVDVTYKGKTVRFQVWDECDDCIDEVKFNNNGFLLVLDSAAVFRNWGIPNAQDTLLATATFVVVPPPVNPQAVLAQFKSPVPGNGNQRKTTITSYNVMSSDNTAPGDLFEHHVNKKFVNSINIAAVHERDWKKYKYNQVDVTYKGKTVRFQVWDLCDDKDCGGCCTANAASWGNGFLLDLDSSAVKRHWGISNAEDTLKDSATFVVVPPAVDDAAVLAQFGLSP